MAAELNPKPFMVAGNHDVGGIATTTKEGPSQKRLDLFEKAVGPHFYAADLPRGMRLVAINTSLLGSGTPLEKAQWELLERELGPSVPARSRVLLMHYPPFVDTPDEPDGYMGLNRPERQAHSEAARGREGGRGLDRASASSARAYRFGTNTITAPPVSFGLPRDKQAPVGCSLRLRRANRSEPRYVTWANQKRELHPLASTFSTIPGTVRRRCNRNTCTGSRAAILPHRTLAPRFFPRGAVQFGRSKGAAAAYEMDSRGAHRRARRFMVGSEQLRGSAHAGHSGCRRRRGIEGRISPRTV